MLTFRLCKQITYQTNVNPIKIKNNISMKYLLFGIGFLLAPLSVDAADAASCILDISSRRSQIASRDQIRCFIDIKCEKRVNIASEQDEYLFSDVLLYANRTLTVLNRQRDCQPLEDRDIFIAVNGAENNLTDFKIPLSWSQVREFNVSHNNITIIRNNSFGNGDIRVIDFSYNQIETIEETAFAGDGGRLIYIEMLLLQNNNLMTLSGNRFSWEQKLKFLDISSNRFEDLRWLENNAFSDLSTIKADYNRITVIGHHFDVMSDLRRLSLVGNSIRFIESHAFVRTSLRVLDLSQNNMETLQPGMFDQLYSLTYLNMSHNKIDAITGDYLMDSLVLSVLDLSHNNLGMFTLSEGRRSAPIDYLMLNDNNLTENDICEVLKLPLKMHHLHVGGNKLHCRHLMLRQAHELVHMNMMKHPEERCENIEIDCSSGGRLEKFGVSQGEPFIRIANEGMAVPEFRREEDFELFKVLMANASSALVEVKLIQYAPTVNSSHSVGSTSAGESHQSIAAVMFVSALVVLSLLAALMVYAIWKYYPNSLYVWRNLRN